MCNKRFRREFLFRDKTDLIFEFWVQVLSSCFWGRNGKKFRFIFLHSDWKTEIICCRVIKMNDLYKMRKSRTNIVKYSFLWILNWIERNLIETVLKDFDESPNSTRYSDITSISNKKYLNRKDFVYIFTFYLNYIYTLRWALCTSFCCPIRTHYHFITQHRIIYASM